MGKRIISQRRGRGTSTYRSNSFKSVSRVKHRPYDKDEKENFILGEIKDLIHSPGHTAPLAVVLYGENETSFIFAPSGMRVGDKISSGIKAKPNTGSTLPLKIIPEGTEVFNIENKPGDGGSLVRASGISAKVLTVTEKNVTIMLPSKKKKVFNPNCRATIGQIAGAGRKEKPFVKAGKKHHAMRSRGRLYPRTSGVCMNAVDHPFGSGRGKHKGKPLTAPRFAPPGRNVGKIKARRTGKKK
tara:strand:+ start:355 stop:1080 length:726 start_codon:yes stop_codon:yes gene_type:complete